MACRTARPKRDLLRIVRSPAGQLAVDRGGRLAGRGAYVCTGGDCLHLALARGGLSRALKTPIPAELRAALLHDAGTASKDAREIAGPQVIAQRREMPQQGGARGKE